LRIGAGQIIPHDDIKNRQKTPILNFYFYIQKIILFYFKRNFAVQINPLAKERKNQPYAAYDENMKKKPEKKRKAGQRRFQAHKKAED
jgi:hypothetical protein